MKKRNEKGFKNVMLNSFSFGDDWEKFKYWFDKYCIMNKNPANIKVDPNTLNVLVNNDYFCNGNDFCPTIEISAENFNPYYEKESERTVLRFLMYNFGKHTFKESIKHYTRKTTINAAIDYVKTYFRK
jgi:hypothetical protein